MSTTALSTAGRFPVRRKRPNRPTLDNASRLVASVVRGPVHVFSEWDRIFKDPMTTLAAIDRVVHHSVVLDLMAVES